jgi:hypothetical protein
MVAQCYASIDPATKDRVGDQQHCLVLSIQADINIMAALLVELFLQDLITVNDLDPFIPVDFDIVNENARVRSEASQ